MSRSSTQRRVACLAERKEAHKEGCQTARCLRCGGLVWWRRLVQPVVGKADRVCKFLHMADRGGLDRGHPRRRLDEPAIRLPRQLYAAFKVSDRRPQQGDAVLPCPVFRRSPVFELPWLAFRHRGLSCYAGQHALQLPRSLATLVPRHSRDSPTMLRVSLAAVTQLARPRRPRRHVQRNDMLPCSAGRKSTCTRCLYRQGTPTPLLWSACDAACGAG